MTTRQYQGWLIIIYKNIPPIPSTYRITILEKATELGALSLQKSVYILPNSPPLKDAFTQLKEQILKFGGECKLLEVASLGEDQEREVISLFNEQSKLEYTKVMEDCKNVLRELHEESEADIQRLNECLDNAMKRDFFSSEFQAEATTLMKECEEKYSALSQAEATTLMKERKEKHSVLIQDSADGWQPGGGVRIYPALWEQFQAFSAKGYKSRRKHPRRPSYAELLEDNVNAALREYLDSHNSESQAEIPVNGK